MLEAQQNVPAELAKVLSVSASARVQHEALQPGDHSSVVV